MPNHAQLASSSLQKEASVRNSRHKTPQGFTLVELMVAITIFTMVVAGCLSSSLLFAKIANNHENVAGFRNDLRLGFENMASDVRNAKSISTRTNRRFTLTYSDSPDITYTYNATAEIVCRPPTEPRAATTMSPPSMCSRARPTPMTRC